MERDGIETQAL